MPDRYSMQFSFYYFSKCNLLMAKRPIEKKQFLTLTSALFHFFLPVPFVDVRVRSSKTNRLKKKQQTYTIDEHKTRIESNK